MIEVNGMNEILRYIENQGISSLEYVDLSKNRESPWGVYCVIIRHCRVSHLTLCGDDDMDRYLFREEIIKSMDINTRLHSLTICDVDEKIYGTFKCHCSEGFNERLLQSQMWADELEFAKPYKKLRCYSLSSSDVINGKITLVVNISERNDGDCMFTEHL